MLTVHCRQHVKLFTAFKQTSHLSFKNECSTKFVTENNSRYIKYHKIFSISSCQRKLEKRRSQNTRVAAVCDKRIALRNESLTTQQ